MIPRKKKTCKGCGQEKYLFGRGLCDACYRRSQSSVNRRSQLNHSKTPLRGKKPEKHTYFGYDSQMEMFNDIWDNMDKPRVCPISKEKLDKLYNTSRWHWCFAHILSKGMFPKWKLNPNNIMVVHPDVHTLIDQGTEDQRKKSGFDFSVFYNIQEELKKEYKKFA